MMWRRYVLWCMVMHIYTCGNVLVVFPIPGRSHTTLGDAVVRSLLEGGHDVTYITTSTQVKSEQLKIINVSPPGEQYHLDSDRSRVSELLQNTLPSHHELTTGAKYAVRALRHDDVQLLMKNKLMSFDVVVAEWFYSTLLAPLGEVFECPLIWYSPVDACWMNLQLVHEAPNPAYSVDLQASSKAAEIPTVGERAYRIWRQMYLAAWQYYMIYYIESPLYYEQYQLAIQRRGRTPPLYEQLVYSGAMLLINSKPALGQNLPLPNNAKYIGGHHVGGSEPLSQELRNVLDNSKYGVIYVNLGLTISAELPHKIIEQLLKMFRQLEQLVIWRHTESLEHIPTNVHVLKWAPQQAILKHPKTILMISHAGYVSYIEAMQYGVPLIGIPVFGDELLTMDLAASRGLGIKVHYTDNLAFKLKVAVDEVFGNYTYRSNVKRVSSILHQHLVPPSQELRYWVELMMSFKGEYLRSPAVRLNMIERYHVDVIGLVFLLYWFFTKVVKLVKVYWNDFGSDRGTEEKEKND